MTPERRALYQEMDALDDEQQRVERALWPDWLMKHAVHWAELITRWEATRA